MRETLTVKELRDALTDMPDEAEVYTSRWMYPQGFCAGAITGARLAALSKRLRKFVKHDAADRDPEAPDVVVLSQWALGSESPLVAVVLSERSIRSRA